MQKILPRYSASRRPRPVQSRSRHMLTPRLDNTWFFYQYQHRHHLERANFHVGCRAPNLHMSSLLFHHHDWTIQPASSSASNCSDILNSALEPSAGQRICSAIAVRPQNSACWRCRSCSSQVCLVLFSCIYGWSTEVKAAVAAFHFLEVWCACCGGCVLSCCSRTPRSFLTLCGMGMRRTCSM